MDIESKGDNLVEFTKYLGLFFHYPLDKETYINIVKTSIGNDLTELIKKKFIVLRRDNVLELEGTKVIFNSSYRHKEIEKFKLLTQRQKKFIANTLSTSINKHLRHIACKSLITLLLEYQFKLILNSAEDLYSLITAIESEFKKLFKTKLVENYHIVIGMFKRELFSDTLKSRIISILYDSNMNNDAIKIYENLTDFASVSTEIKFKVSDALFLTNRSQESNQILEKIEKHNVNNSVLETVEILRLMHNYENLSQEAEKHIYEKLFQEKLDKSEENSLNLFLLVKFSSTLLSHQDAIKLMKESSIFSNVHMIYNNLGALYLTLGSKENDDSLKRYFVNAAGKYLNFADFLCLENEIYSPYIELNKLTHDFYKLFNSKQSFKEKEYKKYLVSYKNIMSKADSLYFINICYCNMYILSILIKGNQEHKNIENLLKKRKKEVNDNTIKRKIDIFLEFGSTLISNSDTTKLPVWIITETHF